MRNRSAAVLKDSDPRAANAARVVPEGAKIEKVGDAILGYRVAKKTKRSYAGSVKRLGELYLILEHRHGGPVDTDDGDVYLEGFVNTIVWNERSRARSRGLRPDKDLISKTVVRACASWLPRISEETVLAAALNAFDNPRKFRADQFADAWQVTLRERCDLGLSSIGTCDLTKAEREAFAKQVKGANDKITKAEKRLQAGMRPQSKSIAAFCRNFIIPQRTFERRKEAGRLDEYLAEKGLLDEWRDFGATIETVIYKRQNAANKEGHCQAPGLPSGFAGAVRAGTDRPAGCARPERAKVRRSEPTVKEAEPVIKSNARAEENETGRTVSDPPRAMLDIFPVTVIDLAKLRKIARLPPEADEALRNATRQVSRVKEVGDEIRSAYTRGRSANG